MMHERFSTQPRVLFDTDRSKLNARPIIMTSSGEIKSWASIREKHCANGSKNQKSRTKLSSRECFWRKSALAMTRSGGDGLTQDWIAVPAKPGKTLFTCYVDVAGIKPRFAISARTSENVRSQSLPPLNNGSLVT